MTADAADDGEWVKVGGIDVWVGSTPDEPELEELLRAPSSRDGREDGYPRDPRAYDQAFPTMPPVQYQLARLKTHLHWVVEHAMTFAADRDEDELSSLLDSARQAEGHLSRLAQLLDPPRDPAGPVK